MSDYTVGPTPDRVADTDLAVLDAAVPPMVPAGSGGRANGAGGAAQPSGQGAQPAQAAEANGRVFASPLARRMAAEKGVDLHAIQGSGPHGRIVKADVENAQPGQAAAPQPAAPAEPAPGVLAAPAAAAVAPAAQPAQEPSPAAPVAPPAAAAAPTQAPIP